MNERRCADRSPAGDPVVAALAYFVEALHSRYPDGPPPIPELDVAITDDMPNMLIVSDPEHPPAA